MTLLAIRGLRVALPPGADRPFAIEAADLDLAAGETLCIVGESGSGKSLTAAAIMGLLPPGVGLAGGSIALAGEDLATAPEARMRALRGEGMAMIFQEPMTALNPLLRIGAQIDEVFQAHRPAMPRADRHERVLAGLDEVGLPEPAATARAYPHELSGGQRQRAMIAMALALEPPLLIADEPTTALDVTTQARILALIKSIQIRRGTGVLFITHDFGVVAEIADRVAVMQHGRIVETGATAAVLGAPRHPYTRALLAAVPPLDPPRRAPAAIGAPVLTVTGLRKTYKARTMFGGGRATVAVAGLGFTLHRGETLGIVGESGSGKSTVARCLVRLLPADAGRVELEGVELLGLSRGAFRPYAARIQMVFQDPYASLNPRRRALDQVAQGPIIQGQSPAVARKKARELLGLVGLDPAAGDRFPHEFSGGQRQRLGLARALALEPAVLVADEPVSALDVSVQAQVLALLAELKARLGLSLVFITHDLRVAAQICDRVLVMHRGEVVEAGPTAELFAQPAHAYTKALLASVPGRRAAAVASAAQ